MNTFENKVAVITGGANGIGRCIAEEFRKNGARVCVIDKSEGEHFVGDISDKNVLEAFTESVIQKHGHIDFLVNNALPLMKGVDECSYEEFQYAMSVGVTAPFYLSKLFAPHFDPGGCIINISSSRDRMSQPQTESYTAAKGGIAALTHSLAVSLAGKVRVNSISPGWIDREVLRIALFSGLCFAYYHLRTCPHRDSCTSFRQILPVTALKILEGRQPVGGFLPCHRQNYA